MIDEGAQAYLGWKEEWIQAASQTLPRANRLDIRPKPFFYSELFMAVRREHDDEIVGAASVTFGENEPPQIGVTMRLDHRKSGLGRPVARALFALLHRHFGEPIVDAYTETTNVGGNRLMVGFGATLLGEPLDWKLPNGRSVLHNKYRMTDPGSVHVCKRPFGPP